MDNVLLEVFNQLILLGKNRYYCWRRFCLVRSIL